MPALTKLTLPLHCRYEHPQAVTPSLIDFVHHSQLNVSMISDKDFLTILFESCNATITDSHTATINGLWVNCPTYSKLTLERALRQDYLWEDNCFECFISRDGQPHSPYLEVNLATNGAFNLYYFDSYRTPTGIPPRRLAESLLDYGQDINFFHQTAKLPLVLWCSASANLLAHIKLVEQQNPLASTTFRVGMVFARSKLDSLLGALGNYAINPTRVMKAAQANELTYWATAHATPPDFHNKYYWVSI